MKKNVMMRVASVLLIAVLMSTCVISGTFAKYTTSAAGGDTARVAKWGVTVTIPDDGAFASSYATTDTNSLTAANSVQYSSNNGADPDEIVAPGTDGTLASITITGKPEVAVNVTATSNVEISNWLVDSALYFPLTFTIKIDDATATNIDITATGNTVDDKVESIESAIEQAIVKAVTGADTATTTDSSTTATVALEANATQLAKTVVVSWTWPFYTDDDSDTKDTELGDATTAATISTTTTVTVTQID